MILFYLNGQMCLSDPALQGGTREEKAPPLLLNHSSVPQENVEENCEEIQMQYSRFVNVWMKNLVHESWKKRKEEDYIAAEPKHLVFMCDGKAPYLLMVI